MAHKHAESMRLYAEDAAEYDEPWLLWEWMSFIHGAWSPCSCNPLWNSDIEYRRKPITININGLEVPEPMRTEPEVGREYYVVSLLLGDLPVGIKWTASQYEKKALSLGILHATREGAIKHAEALLSFTRVQGR